MKLLYYLSEKMTEPAQAYIMAKEILKLPASDPDYISAYERVKQSKWYLQLLSEQLENGSFGRFHTQDTKQKAKRKFVTTEAALRRARDLGLSKDDPMIAKTVGLMERYIRGEEQWPDATEMHKDGGKSWPIAFKTIIAANLSLFDPDHPLVRCKSEICVNNLQKAVIDGRFHEDVWETENLRDNEILLRPFMAYSAWLMRSAGEDAQRAFLHYLWHRKEGIYYISSIAPGEKVRLEDRRFPMWLSALESLFGFSLFPEFMRSGALSHLRSELERLISGGAALPPSPAIIGHYSEKRRNSRVKEADLALRIAKIVTKC